MSVHIVPHGRATEHVLRGLRAFAGVETVYLLTGDAFLDVGDDFAGTLEEFGFDVHQQTIDAFDLRDVVDTIVSIAREHQSEDISINVTGGMNLVAGAATSSAFFVGATPYYVLEPQDDEPLEELVKKLPAPTQPLTFELDGLRREILETLGRWDEQGKQGVILREIGDAVGESPQKVSYHVGRNASRR